MQKVESLCFQLNRGQFRGAGGTWFDGSPSDYGLTADWSSQPNSNLAGFINDFTNGQGGGSGGLVNSSDYKNFVQNGPSSGLLALQQAGNLASPQNIFTIWGASILAGAGPAIGSGIVDIGNLGYGWALENPDAAALLIDYFGGALSPTPGPFTPAGVTGNLAGCSLPTGNPAPYCPGNFFNIKH